jgi:hypothetical protein
MTKRNEKGTKTMTTAREWWGKPRKDGDALFYERVERIETVSPSGSTTREQVTIRATRLDRKGLEAFGGYGRSYVGCAYGYRTTYINRSGQWVDLAPNHDTSVAISLEQAYDNVQRWLRERNAHAVKAYQAETLRTEQRALVASLGGLGMAKEHLGVRQRDLSDAAAYVVSIEAALREARDAYAVRATARDSLAMAITLYESEIKDGAK